jgi:hypothetical protein
MVCLYLICILRLVLTISHLIQNLSFDSILFSTVTYKVVSPESFLFHFFFSYWGLNLGPCACYAVVLPRLQPLFALVCFSDRVLCQFGLQWPGLEHDPPVSASLPNNWDHRHGHHTWFEIKSPYVAQAGLGQWSSYLCLPNTWDYRCKLPLSAPLNLLISLMYVFNSLIQIFILYIYDFMIFLQLDNCLFYFSRFKF